MSEYKRIESIHDLKSVAFALVDSKADEATEDLRSRFMTPVRTVHGKAETLELANDIPPDMFFICPSSKMYKDEKFSLCRALRDQGFTGIVVLLADDITSYGGTSSITAAGFDNYILAREVSSRLEDVVNWAILNRRRRNKYIIQFDGNTEAFFTLDRDGRVYDINIPGVEGAGTTPRKVVVGAMNIRELGTLPFFDNIIQPLITEANVNRTFTNTVQDTESIFQIKTCVHNVTTMGLVATVVKTDITETIYSHTMDILTNSVGLLSQRDHYTAGHSMRVYHYCRNIIERMELDVNKHFSRDLFFAAFLHDIGKIGVSDTILLKKGKLTEGELADLSTHPAKGYQMLRQFEFLQGSMDFVLYHHERPDGMGYPDKLTSSRIPLGASIISVADSFDAMTSNRPYRRSLSYERAIAEINDNIGTQYDADVAKAFLSVASPSMQKDAFDLSNKPMSTITHEMISSLTSA
ncbi:HD-GYP domain-containing protein [Nitrospirota bacterium]